MVDVGLNPYRHANTYVRSYARLKFGKLCLKRDA